MNDIKFPIPNNEKHLIKMLSKAEKLKGVLRLNKVMHGERQENSAEHSWQAALTGYTLSHWSNKPIDVAKVMLMLLSHDLVEIDAGDTDPFDPNANIGKDEREILAANSLFGVSVHPTLDTIHQTWREFEFSQTAEAKFARAIDKFMPLFLNAVYDGSVWVHHNLTRSAYVDQKQSIAEGSDKLWEYSLILIDYSISKGWICEG